MKKFLTLALSLMLLVVCTALADNPSTPSDLTASAEEQVLLSGIVLAVEDDHLLVMTDEGQQVQVNLFDETVWSTYSEGTVVPGDYVLVSYSGQMTFSLPAQIAAQVVTCYRVSGTVTGMEEDGSLLVTDADECEWLVKVPGALAEQALLLEGMEITVFFNGIATRSLPPQITAAHIRTITLTGTITEVEEKSFTLVDAEGQEQIVHLTENVALCVALEVGAEVEVVTTNVVTASLPAQYQALEVLPAPVQLAESEELEPAD